MNLRLSAFLLFFLVFLECVIASAQVIRFRPGRLRFETQLDYFTTKANFDFPGGSFTDLGTGKSYQSIRSQSDFVFEWSDRFSTAIGLHASQAQSNDGMDTRTSSRLHRVSLRTRWLANRRYFQFIPEFTLSGSTFDIADDVDEVLVDDDATRAELGAWLQKRFWGFNNYLYLGYQFRDKDFSHLATYKLGTTKRFQKYYVGGEVDGFASITDDTFTDTPVNRTAVTDRVNAGSLVNYSINPNLLNGTLWGGVKVADNFFLKLGLKQALNGESYAAGSTVFFRLEIRSIYLSDRYTEDRDSDQMKLEKEFVPATGDDEELADELFMGQEVEIQLEKKRRDDSDAIQDDD